MSFPSPARDHAEQGISLDKELIRHPHATFFMRAEGDSMLGAFIPPRALLVIDKSMTPKSGDIVVAVKEGEFTVRYLKMDGFSKWLCTANRNYPDHKICPDDDITVWGVVIQIIVNPKELSHVFTDRC